MKVWTKKAEHEFSVSKFESAAESFARSSSSFEFVALKFINANQFDALRTFLKYKLKALAKSDATQQFMLCAWLTELYLNKIVEFEQAKKDPTPIRKEFHIFLQDYKEKLDTKTTFHLMASHGKIDDLLYYAEVIAEFEKLVQYHLQHSRWIDALDVLSKQRDESLYYKHCPLLMEKMPHDTVNLLMMKNHLSPKLLLPAVMRYESVMQHGPKTEHQGIRYLQYVVTERKETDVCIHNYLLYLYAKHSDEGPLLNFLKQKDTVFDFQYALRLCSEYDKQQAKVLVYSKMGLFEEAVDAALEMNNLPLAEDIANVGDNDELKKKLWLRIAAYVIKQEKQISKAIAILHHSKLLKIEDILLLFPEFVLVDDFKDDICAALKGYNQNLEGLQQEMKVATDTTELLTEDIAQIRENYVIIDANQKCEICKYPTLTRPFYVFPCNHSFHCDCLSDEMVPFLSKSEGEKLKSLRNKLKEKEAPTLQPQKTLLSTPFTFFEEATHVLTNTPVVAEQTQSLNVGVSEKQLKDQIDDLIAYECILCNGILVNSVDAPFVDPSNVDLNDTWKVPMNETGI